MSASQQRQPINRALTLRERQVAALVSRGLSNKQVARQLEMSEGTVKIHLHNIYGKLGVPNRTALTALALVERRYAGASSNEMAVPSRGTPA